MDEIEVAHEGRVDEWKVFRAHAFQIAISSGNYKNIPTPEQMLPLPYDELTEELSIDDEEFYNNAIK